MAKNVTLWGASYSNVPAINVPQTGGGTARFTDTSPTTATDSDVTLGKIYFKADGSQSTGTGEGGGGGTYQTKNVTYTPTKQTQTQSVTADSGYDALEEVNVTVNPIPSQYIVPTGNKEITANGTNIDVAQYSTVSVAVPSSGTSKNTQVVQGTTRTSSSSMTAIGAELTVSKTGTYDIYWSGFRSNTSSSYTYATQLYIDNTAHGSENTTWSNHVQNNHLTNVSLTQNQKLRVRGRNSRGSSYYIYAPTLVIVET